MEGAGYDHYYYQNKQAFNKLLSARLTDEPEYLVNYKGYDRDVDKVGRPYLCDKCAKKLLHLSSRLVYQ